MDKTQRKEMLWDVLGLICAAVICAAIFNIMRFILWWCYDMGCQM